MLFALSSAVGGLAAGIILGTLGSALPAQMRIALGFVFALAATALALTELTGHRVAIAQCSRETPQRWVHAGASRWAVLNGLALGCGATSRLGFWSWYAIPASSILLGDLWLGAVVFGAYGLSRGLGAWILLIWSSLSPTTKFDDIARLLLQRYPAARQVMAWHLLLLGGVTFSVLLS